MLQVVVWRADRLKFHRSLSGLNDLYVKCWFDAQPKQRTDVHWRARWGSAAWNWRLKFSAQFPHLLRHHNARHARMYLQVWDKDLVPPPRPQLPLPHCRLS